MMLWTAVGLIFGLFGIVHVVFIREENSPHLLNNDALKGLAKELGLQFTTKTKREESGPIELGRFHGTVDQFRINVREYTTEYGEQIPFRCVYEIHTTGHDLSHNLLMYREGPPSKIGKILGGEDIETGHSTIDQAFVIRDTSPNSAQEMFARADVVDAFMHLTTLTSKITFENHKLTVVHSGTRLNAQQAHTNIAALLRCAKLLDDAETTTAREEAKSMRRSFTQGKSPTWQSAP